MTKPLTRPSVPGSAASRQAASPTLLAFDFGLRRTGVACGNSLTRTAQALLTIDAVGDARFDAIARVIREWQPGALVVGVPFYPDGTAHDNTTRARRFARQLQGRFNLPVHEVDERYSTVEARAQGASDLDAAAAALLLEQYFHQSTAQISGRTLPEDLA